MTALKILQPIVLQQTSTHFNKQGHPDQIFFSTGTFFVPHINVAKTEIFFINTLCPKPEEFQPIFMAYHENHPIQLNKGIIRYAMFDNRKTYTEIHQKRC